MIPDDIDALLAGVMPIVRKYVDDAVRGLNAEIRDQRETIVGQRETIVEMQGRLGELERHTKAPPKLVGVA